jgi:class 3 adenylate cyclase
MKLPTGTVTFLFTDIEGSTRLLQRLGDGYHAAQDDHARILRQAIDEGGGVATRTEGDSFFAVFADHTGAVRAAATAQRTLAAHQWPHGTPLLVRMGLHTGRGVLGGDDYLGIDVNRAARIAAAGHGGQVLLSEATRSLVRHDLPDGVHHPLLVGEPGRAARARRAARRCGSGLAGQGRRPGPRRVLPLRGSGPGSRQAA